MPGKSLTSVLLLQLLPRLVLAVSYSILDGGTQFIDYNGTISGNFKHANKTVCGDGGTYYFSDLVNASLKIGVNPPWDSNPFFFEFQHYGNDYNSQGRSRKRFSKKDICISIGGCTYDPVYNLLFRSARFQCQKDGHACGSIEFSPFYYVGLELLNLSAATISNTTGAIGGQRGPVPLYAVEGDEHTYVSNGTASPDSFDFQRPHNYTLESGCVDSMTFAWDKDTPFTYALNFTNTSSAALLTLSDPAGTITLSFTGSRLDLEDDDYEPSDNGNYSAISMDSPTDNAIPHFTFTNGTQFSWHHYEDGGTWDALSSSLAQSQMGSLAWRSLWCIMLGVVSVNLFH